MPIALLVLCVAAVLTHGGERAHAAQVSLEVANLTQPSFEYYIRGPFGWGEGELAMPALNSALDASTVPAGAMLYDRDVIPADPGLARSFDTLPVRLTGVARAPAVGGWQSTVSWEATPGQRAVWLVQPATQNFQRVRHLAVSGRSGELRYYIPYQVSLFSTKPLLAIAYPLYFLQSSEGRAGLWNRYLARKVDLATTGIATVIGRTSSLESGDWVYIVVDSPAESVAYRVVIGWGPRGSPTDQVITGTGGGIQLSDP